MGVSVIDKLGVGLVRNVDLIPACAESLAGAMRCRATFAQVRRYCMFVGYPRSGHSLLGSLLNAHADAVVSHELDALRYFRFGFRRDQVFWLILERDRWFGRRGRTWTGYAYEVPGQWQGRFRRLHVIGDKGGGSTTDRLRRWPGLFDVLRRRLGVGLRVIHHIRNPFDNISTMWRKRRRPVTLERMVDQYFALCRTVATVLPRLGDEEVVQSRHEAFVTSPREELDRLVAFLGLTPTDDYLDACARLVFPSPKQSRRDAPWTPQLIERVQRGIDTYEFLRGYGFES